MATNQPASCVIGPQISIRGSIAGEEDLLVEGRVEGAVALEGHLTVAQTGIVEADVEVGSIEVHGELVGDIIATRSVSIERGARVVGNVRAPRVIIHDGANFDGAVDMHVALPEPLAKNVR
jgi:cytoskeletal protein CcmA (bactofilin family)